MSHTLGTLPEGGAFESVFVLLSHYRDRLPVAVELFELDELERVRADVQRRISLTGEAGPT